MTTANATTTKPTLYWSERGQIGCATPGHAPYVGTDTWVWERWKKITPREAAQFEREVGRPPSCETCDAIARRA
ncbi:MAG: hypothetical protein ACKVXR_15525 [Planctomycetota bacterium]